MAMKHDMDMGEKGYSREPDTAAGYIGDEGAVHKNEFIAGNSVYARLQRFAGKFGVEQRGIERVPSDERTDTDMSKIGSMVSPPPPPFGLPYGSHFPSTSRSETRLVPREPSSATP